jgi:uncharacterized repeat protein (TIGR03803 family)
MGSYGGYPNSVILDSKGNVYGTASGGGASGNGVVFKIDTSGNETVLYSFTGGTDGSIPAWVVLARDSAGNLYGTTAFGGASGNGVVFRIDTSGNETVLQQLHGRHRWQHPLRRSRSWPERQPLRDNRVRRANKRRRRVRNQTIEALQRGEPTVY